MECEGKHWFNLEKPVWRNRLIPEMDINVDSTLKNQLTKTVNPEKVRIKTLKTGRQNQ
jgi:hypothetical protein